MVRVHMTNEAREDKSVVGQQTRTFSSIVSSLFEQDSFFDVAADHDPAGSLSGSTLVPDSPTSQQNQDDSDMAPPRQNLLPKDRFALAFSGLRTQSYHDPIARAPGSHT